MANVDDKAQGEKAPVNDGRFKKGNPGGPGRPTRYTQKLADEICAQLKLGHSVRKICRQPGMPDERTVRDWAHSREHPFYPQYTEARELGYQAMAEEILEISDGQSEDADAARDRLRLDTRRWLLSKCLPKIYGEKGSLELTGKDGEPIEINDTASARRVAFMLGKAVGKKSAEKAETESD
jgi:hypothetical protein